MVTTVTKVTRRPFCRRPTACLRIDVLATWWKSLNRSRVRDGVSGPPNGVGSICGHRTPYPTFEQTDWLTDMTENITFPESIAGGKRGNIPKYPLITKTHWSQKYQDILSQFSSTTSSPLGSILSNNRIIGNIVTVVNTRQFNDAAEPPLGGHSIRRSVH